MKDQTGAGWVLGQLGFKKTLLTKWSAIGLFQNIFNKVNFAILDEVKFDVQTPS